MGKVSFIIDLLTLFKGFIVPAHTGVKVRSGIKGKYSSTSLFIET